MLVFFPRRVILPSIFLPAALLLAGTDALSRLLILLPAFALSLAVWLPALRS